MSCYGPDGGKQDISLWGRGDMSGGYTRAPAETVTWQKGPAQTPAAQAKADTTLCPTKYSKVVFAYVSPSPLPSAGFLLTPGGQPKWDWIATKHLGDKITYK